MTALPGGQPGVLGTIGSRSTQKRLLDYLRSGRLHPSLILAGPDPELKYRVAKNMAKALLCEKPGLRAFCAGCSTCRRIDKEIHPDVLFVKEEEQDTIKIELVRSVCHQMEISPMEAPAKICIVQECHRMSNASANAFLKTLEEPAAGRYFWLLTTQVGSLLPTLLSRCLQFSFAPEEPVADTAENEIVSELDALFADVLRTKNPQPLIAKLEDKEKCLVFLRRLQTRLHGTAGASQGTDLFSSLEKFESAVALEGRLRSNANCGLLVEDFIRREFLA